MTEAHHRQMLHQMKDFFLVAVLLIYAATLSWSGDTSLKSGRWTLIGSGIICLVPVVWWPMIHVISLLSRLGGGGSWDLPRDLHRFIENVAPVCLFSGIVFMVAGLWNLPPWLLVAAGAAMIAWVIVLSIWAVLNPGERCMQVVSAVDRASWPISWAAFQVAVVANYQTIVNTIDNALMNNQQEARPWYLSHVPEAIIFLAILVTVLGLLATALQARPRDETPAPGPDMSPGAGAG